MQLHKVIEDKKVWFLFEGLLELYQTFQKLKLDKILFLEKIHVLLQEYKELPFHLLELFKLVLPMRQLHNFVLLDYKIHQVDIYAIIYIYL